MKLRLGDIWISESHPHESFEIYGGTADTCTDAEVKYDMGFDEQFESVKIFFWRKHDYVSFHNYVEEKLGKECINTFPYASCGECKKYQLTKKIKEFDMKLSKEKVKVESAYIV